MYIFPGKARNTPKDNELIYNHRRNFFAKESRANKRAWHLLSAIIKVEAVGFRYMQAVMGTRNLLCLALLGCVRRV